MKETLDFVKADVEVQVPPEIWERGSNYLAAGHLLCKYRIDNVLAGLVAGTAANYQVQLRWDDELRGSCSCPQGRFCKHMVALALAWIEDRTQFTDLRPELDCLLADPEQLGVLIGRLAHDEPLFFAKLFTTSTNHRVFVANRSLLNLVRNIFSYPQFAMAQIRATVAKIENVKSSIAARLANGDILAFEAYLELLAGVAQTLKTAPSPALGGLLAGILGLAVDLPKVLPGEQWQPVIKPLLTCYFEPALWEYQSEFKTSLEQFAQLAPERFATELEKVAAELGPANITALIAEYELLSTLERQGRFQNRLAELTRELAQSETGRFWLIDRLSETDVAQAFQLARNGLRQATDSWSRQGFQERLLRLHETRAEMKQAALFSFHMFETSKDFHEYLRLKKLLHDFPDEYAQYLKRIYQMLDNDEELPLLLRIAVWEGEGSKLDVAWPKITARPELARQVAVWLADSFHENLLEFYPKTIVTLLTVDDGALDWSTVTRLLLIVKRRLLQGSDPEHWDLFRRQLLDNSRAESFHRKLGTLLSG
jgi:hypothetical protein